MELLKTGNSLQNDLGNTYDGLINGQCNNCAGQDCGRQDCDCSPVQRENCRCPRPVIDYYCQSVRWGDCLK